jgi:hypothetical protein
MPDNYYDDGPESSTAKAPQEDGSGPKTCTLPKDAFPDAQPGQVLTLEVVRVHDDEIEVAPQGSDQEEAPPEEAPAPDEGGSDEGPMRSMLED